MILAGIGVGIFFRENVVRSSAFSILPDSERTVNNEERNIPAKYIHSCLIFYQMLIKKKKEKSTNKEVHTVRMIKFEYLRARASIDDASTGDRVGKKKNYGF